MPSLAETQARFGAAIIERETDGFAPLLKGGRDPLERLAIHQRHFESSLTTALIQHFPAMEWLVGTAPMAEAAASFVRRHPPAAPCIAEYGEGFPRWLAARAAPGTAPWLHAVGEIEWRVGRAAVSIDHDPVPISALAGIDPERLPDIRLTLQPGLSYLSADWPADDLLKLFLSESTPESYALDPLPVRLEIVGARGAFSMTRLGSPDFLFRQAIRAGESLGEAAGRAAGEKDFAAGPALAAVFADGLVTSIGRKDRV